MPTIMVRPGVALLRRQSSERLKANPMQADRFASGAPILQVRAVAQGRRRGIWRDVAGRTGRRASQLSVLVMLTACMRAMSWPAVNRTGPAQGLHCRSNPVTDCRAGIDGHDYGRRYRPQSGAPGARRARRSGVAWYARSRVDDWARWAGTIPYEILTSLGRRYAKVYSS